MVQFIDIDIFSYKPFFKYKLCGGYKTHLEAFDLCIAV